MIHAAVSEHVSALPGRVRALYEDAERGYVVTAAVRLKGPYRLLAPFVKRLVRARMRRYVLEPLKAAAEAGG